MLLVTHAAVGAAVAYKITNPLGAFLAGFVFHFIGDFIPHGDNSAVQDYRNGHKNVMRKVIIFDIFLTLAYILAVALRLPEQDLHFEQAVYWGMIGGLAPDFFVALYEVTKFKVLKSFHAFHFWVHDYLEEYDISLWLSLILQGVFLFFLFNVQL